MEILKLFPKNLVNNASMISRDQKIYEAFSPYLSDIKGISREDFMKNKSMRREYQDKFNNLKSFFQKQRGKKKPLTDEEGFSILARNSRDWQEFISVARENTLDEGKSFIESTPLDVFAGMTTSEKYQLETKLTNAILERIRSFDTIENPNIELRRMLSEGKDENLSKETHHK